MIKTIGPLWQENTHRYLSLDTLFRSWERERPRKNIRGRCRAFQPRCKDNLKTRWETWRGTFAAVYLWYKRSECAKVKGNTAVGFFYDYNTCRLIVTVWWELNGLILFIFQVLAFFSARLEQHPDQTLSVGVVLDVIKQGALQWPRDRLKVTCFSSVKTKHFKLFSSALYKELIPIRAVL